jgi:hypothetical protein
MLRSGAERRPAGVPAVCRDERVLEVSNPSRTGPCPKPFLCLFAPLRHTPNAAVSLPADARTSAGQRPLPGARAGRVTAPRRRPVNGPLPSRAPAACQTSAPSWVSHHRGRRIPVCRPTLAKKKPHGWTSSRWLAKVDAGVPLRELRQGSARRARVRSARLRAALDGRRQTDIGGRVERTYDRCCCCCPPTVVPLDGGGSRSSGSASSSDSAPKT